MARRTGFLMQRAGSILAATFIFAALLAIICGRGALSDPSLTKLSPPTPSAAANSAFAQIGLLERDRKTSPEKLRSFLHAADPAVVSRALIALGRIGNPDAVATLSNVLRNQQSSDDEKASAAFALGFIGSPDAVSVLASSAQGGAPSVAAAAANALGRIGGPNAVDTLTRLLGSHDANVRTQAAVGLGTAALPGAPSIDFAHRQAAAHALAADILTERDREVKWHMAWALGRAFYQNQAPTLRRLLTDDEELVRLFAVEGLGRLRDRTYALPVRLIANDSSWRVRVEVKNALTRLRDRTTVTVNLPRIPKADLAPPDPMPSSAPFGDHPQVAIVTNKGVIVLELFPDQAPYSVDNFLSLADRGFYNGLTYFRVIADFVVQGGDPKNTGDGGPGYTIPAELNPLEQLTGIISYGLDYDPKRNVPLLDSAGSQYYITESPQLHLDKAFTVFGRVVSGMAVVDNIAPHSAGDAAPADVVKRVYRCKPVINQTAEVEQKLRHAEIGYDAR